MIDIHNVSFGYPGHRDLYSDLSISLPGGSIYGLLGRNGSGKSTLLYLIAGLLRPRKGTVRFLGDETILRHPSTLSRIFILPEDFALPHGNIRKMVRNYAPFYPRFSEEIMESCLSEFGLDTDAPFRELSMGNKKKAYVSFALAVNTPLLLMDEPTNGLDIPSKAQFRKVVSRCMSEDKTVIISTHQVKDIDTLLDHLLIIDNGRIMLNSPISDIAKAYSFERRKPGESTADAVYAEEGAYGSRVIVSNRDGADTPVDLETLFTAAIEGKISIERKDNEQKND